MQCIYIYIYVMEYYLAIKRDEIWSFLEPGPRVCYTECSKSEREKQISYINTYMGNLEKWYRWTYLQGRNRDADIENRGVAMVGVNGGGMNWETDRSLFIGSTISGYFKRYPEESNGRVGGGNPKLRLFLNVQTLGVNRIVIHSCQIQKQKFKKLFAHYHFDILEDI